MPGALSRVQRVFAWCDTGSPRVPIEHESPFVMSLTQVAAELDTSRQCVAYAERAALAKPNRLAQKRLGYPPNGWGDIIDAFRQGPIR